MSDSFEFTLHSPLTKEDWDKITDVKHENTMSVTFLTPQDRQVRYIKCEVLDKIRAEIEQYLFQNEFGSEYRKEVSQIIDKYKAESEDKNGASEEKIEEAMIMAIKALEQDPIVDKIRTEIEKQDKWLAQAGYNAYNVDIAFNSIKRVVAESEVRLWQI